MSNRQRRTISRTIQTEWGLTDAEAQEHGKRVKQINSMIEQLTLLKRGKDTVLHEWYEQRILREKNNLNSDLGRQLNLM